MKAEPQKEHLWLKKLLGDWTAEADPSMDPAHAPPPWSETVRSLGDLWVVADGEGQMPGGGDAITMMTLGYDARKQRFVGTWVGSMMTFMWVYDGSLNEAENVLTLNSEGPSFDGTDKTAKYQDIIEFEDDDHRSLTARVLGEDGEWKPMMKVNYTRKS